MYKLPLLSTAIPKWPLNAGSNAALVAGPPSPEKPLVPFPATVLRTPAVFTLRILRLPASTINRLPFLSAARPFGEEIWAPIAGPLSPEKPSVPLPTIVLIVPAASWARQSLCVPRTANAASPLIEAKAVLSLTIDSWLYLTVIS
jgi:hypothetical protein